MKLNGITAPDGPGKIVEVHLDIQQTTPQFTAWLESLGFQDDPFASFFPLGYIAHMTGRLRIPPSEIKGLLPDLNVLVFRVITRAIEEGHALYSEVEIVQDIQRFDPKNAPPFERILDSLLFSRSGKFGGAKSDVHVEFDIDGVTPEVHAYLEEKHFYWVSTPETKDFPPEAIATLQTSSFHMGVAVCKLLTTHPLPGMKDFHLEQKLSMNATNYNLTMPEVIDVIK